MAKFGCFAKEMYPVIMSISRLIVLGLLCVCLSAHSEDWAVYSELNSFTFSAPLPVKNFLGDFDGDLKDGDTALTHNRFEVGMRRGRWRIGWVERYDYRLQFSRDALFVNALDKQDIDLPVDRSYRVLIDAQQSVSQGLIAGVAFTPHRNSRVEVSVTFLKGKDYLDGKVNLFAEPQNFPENLGGEITALLDQLTELSNGTPLEQLQALALLNDTDALDSAFAQTRAQIEQIALSGVIDYHYRDPEFGEEDFVAGGGQEFGRVDGRGYVADIHWTWQPSKHFVLTLSLEDLFHRMKWRDSGYTFARFDARNNLFTALDQFEQAVDAALSSGTLPSELPELQADFSTEELLAAANTQIRTKDFTQELPWRANMSMQVNLNETYSLLGGVYRTEPEDFPRLGFGIHDTWKFTYDFRTKGVGIGYFGRYLTVNVLSDSFDLNKTHVFGLNVSLNYGW